MPKYHTMATILGHCLHPPTVTLCVRIDTVSHL